MPKIFMIFIVLVFIFELARVSMSFGYLNIGLPLIVMRILGGLVWKNQPLSSSFFGHLSH